ncbi:MAG: hypothetical protein ACHP93_05565 [Solirubrobacterales bacterium]
MAKHLALIAVLGLVGATGCGATRTKAGLTRAQFIAAADGVCRVEEVRLEYIEQRAATLEGASVASFRSVPRLIRKAVAIHEAANAKLEALAQPPAETTAIGKWLTARIVATTIALDAAEAPAGHDLVATKDLQQQLSRAITLVRGLAHRYGFAVCDAAE